MKTRIQIIAAAILSSLFSLNSFAQSKIVTDTIKVYGNCTTPSLEPVEIVLACADYGTVLEGLHWINWTAASAMAVGTLV